eukprot:CAMPEP_0179259450 /NCGR_PEP_ID=MMETSP0797-20121207/25832_1 /TAXON_ID=47934 /ORGANISM="Dinophysis acuminata, Strain DAEP01" /LENGTH=107 /DNA_ID=CAMNT_0020967503 /DNA_START=119 /DNA_END=439 /DNA_ORIENTATION=+
MELVLVRRAGPCTRRPAWRCRGRAPVAPSLPKPLGDPPLREDASNVVSGVVRHALHAALRRDRDPVHQPGRRARARSLAAACAWAAGHATLVAHVGAGAAAAAPLPP